MEVSGRGGVSTCACMRVGDRLDRCGASGDLAQKSPHCPLPLVLTF